VREKLIQLWKKDIVLEKGMERGRTDGRKEGVDGSGTGRR
jgi:hypothetical protein